MQLQQEPSPAHPQDDDDDMIMVDSVPQSPGKRKGEGDGSSPRPAKRQSFWVQVPPRPKRTLPDSVKSELQSPDDTIQAPAPAVKEDPDQEMSAALAVIRNVSHIVYFPLRVSWNNRHHSHLVFLPNRQTRRKARRAWVMYPFIRGSRRLAWISFR